MRSIAGVAADLAAGRVSSRELLEQALARMRTALSETVVEGIQTNIALHRELMADASFMAGGTNIHYLENWLGRHKR